MKKFKTLVLVFIILTLTVSCDQVTKRIAKIKLSGGPVYSYFYDTVRLIYVENTGAFLSFGANFPDSFGCWIFIAFPLIMMAVLLIYIVLSKRLPLQVTIAFSLIAGGGIGNLIDRIAHHRLVIDFMNVGIGSLRTGIFNFADFFVMTGTFILVLTSIFTGNPDKTI